MYIMFNIWWLILVVYINVTEDQLLSIFCLSEILRDFYSISRKLFMLMNTEDKGFYYLEKVLCIKDVKNTQRHTLCHQDCSSSCSAAPFALSREEAGSRDAHVGVLCHTLDLGHAFG